MPKVNQPIKFTTKKQEEVLAALASNNGDVVKTSEDTGIQINDIYKLRKQALQRIDYVRIKHGKEFVELGHKFLVDLIKSKEFKNQVHAASLKEVTEFIVKLMDKLKEYQAVLGFSAVDMEEVERELVDPSKTRQAEEADKIRLVPEDENEQEVQFGGTNTSEYLES